MSELNFFQYADLVDTLIEWGKKYESGESPVSDSVYDSEYKKLKEFEKKNPDKIINTSPTQKVGTASGFNKIQHKYPMLSIANINSHDELREWVKDKINKGVRSLVLEFKIDGISLSLNYINGELNSAVTRGDGTTGEESYANAMQIANIPKTIPLKDDTEIRGEVVWFNDAFTRINQELIDLGKKPFSNPRNGAAGTMKLLEPKEVARRGLSFIAYRSMEGINNDLHSSDMDAIKSMGFTTSKYYLFDLTKTHIEEIVNAVKYMDIERQSLPYLTDGLVIKVNEKNMYSKLGGTAKAPHAFGAYKFPPEVKSTPLVKIHHSYGKSGSVTPVAEVQTINLSLTNVTMASLHNWDMVEYLGFHEGCTVNIRKAGEIIPEIISVNGINGRCKDSYEMLVDKHGREYVLREAEKLSNLYPNLKFIKRPTHCKHCSSILTQDSNRQGDTLVALICPNEKCPSKVLKNLEAFVSKDCMNIMHMGESTINDLFNYGSIVDFRSFYELKKDSITNSGLGDRIAERILESIDVSRKNHLNQLLNAFCIDGVGKGTSERLADHFGHLGKLNDTIKNSPSEIATIQDIGDDSSKSIIEWFTENQEIVNYFIDNNIATTSKPKIVKGNTLSGLTCIMTGKSSLIERNEFKQIVVEQGGKVSSSITGKVDIVLLGDSAGPAKVKAIAQLQQDGSKIRTVTDQEFLQMIGKSN